MSKIEFKVFENDKPLTPDQANHNKEILDLSLGKILSIPASKNDWKIERWENDPVLRTVYFGEMITSLEVIFKLWNELSPEQKKEVYTRESNITDEADYMYGQQTAPRGEKRNFKAEIKKAFDNAREQDRKREPKLKIVRIKGTKPRS